MIKFFILIELLRISLSFRDLGEYADAADGRIERWLLVPSSMTLAALSFAIGNALYMPWKNLHLEPSYIEEDVCCLQRWSLISIEGKDIRLSYILFHGS